MRKPDRRIALVAVVLAVAGLSAACSGASRNSSTSTSSTSSNSSLTTMTPKPTSTVDKVTWNDWEGEPNTIDPFLSADYSPNMINSNMCEDLLAQKPDFSITPNLASSFSNPDPLHWVYNLRADVKFWDGQPMTADDVAWSMNHNLTDAATFYHYLYGNVKSIAVSGAHQVTVTLKQPDYLFNNELSDYAGVVVEKKFFLAHAKDFGSPSVGVMCTGPFKFQSWTKGQSITMVRNDNYWNKDLQPKVKTLVFTFLTDDSAITDALQTGQIDGAYDLPLSGLQQLQSSSAGTVYQGPAPLSFTIVYSNPQGPMSNLKLRQALQMAINWDGIAQTILKGTGTPLRAQDPPAVFGYAKTELTAGYNKLPDPESAQYDKAKQLVKQAGPDASRSITMAVPSPAQWQQFGNAIVDAATRIGLHMHLKVVPTAEYTNYLYDPKTRAGVDILATDFWPNAPDPLDWFGITALHGGSFNQYGYSGIDTIYHKAQATQDPKQRAQILVQLQAKLRQDLLPMVPGINHTNTMWLNKRITGAPASFDWPYFPWAAYLGGTGK